MANYARAAAPYRRCAIDFLVRRLLRNHLVDAGTSADREAAEMLGICLQGPTRDCSDVWNQHAFKPSWGLAVEIAAVAFAPIPVVWLIAWIVFVATRWIRCGFQG